MFPYRTHTLLGLLLAALLGLAAPRPALAGLAVSPLKQEISVRPGEQAKFTLNLINRVRTDADGPQSTTLSIKDVSVLVDGGLEFKEPYNQKNSASKWITTSQKQVTVDAGKSFTVEFTIAPPSQTAPGEYYSAIIVTLASRGHTAKGVEIQYEVASGVFVTVMGQTLPKQAKITNCEIQWPALTAQTQPAEPANPAAPPVEPPTAKVAVVIQNTGSSRFNGTGKMRIVDLDHGGRVVMTALLTSHRPCVFGGDSRRFEAPLTKPLPPGKYAIKVDMDYESSWAKAYTTQIVDLTAEQAALLKHIKDRQASIAVAVNVSPVNFNQIIPAGGSRSLGVGIKSGTDVPVRCMLSAASTGEIDIDSWITIASEDFNLSPSAHKSVEVKLAVPADAKTGNYTATLAVETWPEGSELRRTEIPIEIQVKGRGTQP